MAEFDIDKLAPDTQICLCMEITLEEILEAIKNGACTVEEIMDATDAGTACGLCKSREDDPDEERDYHLDEILEQAKQKGYCP